MLLRARDAGRLGNRRRRYFQAKFDRILVDEFQDTDPLQAEIVALLAENPATPPAADWRQVGPLQLFIVGDPKQSIYRFRRAGPPGTRGRQDTRSPVRRRCPAADGQHRAVRD